MLVWPVSRPPVLEHEKEHVVYTPVKKSHHTHGSHLDVIWANGLGGAYSIAINMGGLVCFVPPLYPTTPTSYWHHTHTRHHPFVFQLSCSTSLRPPSTSLSLPLPPLTCLFYFFCRGLCYDKGFTPRMHAVSACVMPF